MGKNGLISGRVMLMKDLHHRQTLPECTSSTVVLLYSSIVVLLYCTYIRHDSVSKQGVPVVELVL